MRLELFKTFWGFGGSPREAASLVRDAGFQGIEAPVPEGSRERDAFARAIADDELAFIAEVTTGGGYVPRRTDTPQDHLRELDSRIAWGKPLAPRFFTVITGSDAWPLAAQIDFFRCALDIAARHAVVCSFETHRSRSLFHPYATLAVIDAVPELRLTCDFSHWVVVCERLLDDDEDVMREVTGRAHHVHARVGYPQGPQVPHPAAPEYAECLAWHERAWARIWAAQRGLGYACSTMTPEFGPDGYLHTLPFTNAPVADLWEINTWMGARQRRRFEAASAALEC